MNHQKVVFTIFTVLAMVLTAQSQSWLTDGLVAYYQFKGNANDASGHGNNATVHGICSYGIQTNLSRNYIQTTNSGYVLFPNFTGKITNNITVSCWVKMLDSTPWDYPVFFGTDNQFQKWMGIDLSQGFGIGDTTGIGDGSGVVWMGGTTTDVSGIWKHYVFTYTPGTFSGYVDGALAKQTNVTVSALALTPGALGWHQWVGGNSANGSWQFANTRIYNRALSLNEISQLYAIESAPAINIGKAVYLTSANLLVGTNYQVQISTDLVNWTNSGSVFTATNSVWHSTDYWDVPNWNQLNFRLQQQ